VRIPADVPPAAGDPAAALAEEARISAPGSQERADVEYVLEFARRHGASAAAGRRATVERALRTNAWWYAGRAAPRRRTLLVDQDGIIYTYRRGHGFAVNPVATTGRWRGLNDDVPPERLAETLLPLGVERRVGDREYLAWEYFDVGDDPGAVRPGLSGMAQGRMAELMATAYRRTGDARFAGAARRALAAFTVSVDEGGVRSMVAHPPGRSPSPWYVERAYPGEDPWKGAALNGFMVAVLNLRGTSAQLSAAAAEQASAASAAASPDSPSPAPPAGVADAQAGSDLARRLSDAGAETLERYLPLHDSGSWSYYGLLTPGRPWRTYLADLNYHCYHIALLRRLAELYPERTFMATAERWQGYVDAAGRVCPPR
jgi:hypothetical protein